MLTAEGAKAATHLLPAKGRLSTCSWKRTAEKKKYIYIYIYIEREPLWPVLWGAASGRCLNTLARLRELQITAVLTWPPHESA